jgi:hypothetical protein
MLIFCFKISLTLLELPEVLPIFLQKNLVAMQKSVNFVIESIYQP